MLKFKKTVLQEPALYVNLWTTNKLRPIPKKETKMFVKLYTSPTCSNCEPVKKKLEAAGIAYEIRDTTDLEARGELLKQGVRAVPYLHAENAVGSEYKALGNAINIQSLVEFLGDEWKVGLND